MMKPRKAKPKKQPLYLDVVGLQYRVTKPVRRLMKDYLPFVISLEREPDNHHDPNAIAVKIADAEVPYDKMKIGYLRRQVAEVLAPILDSGDIYKVSALLTKIYIDDGTAEAEVILNNGKIRFDKSGVS